MAVPIGVAAHESFHSFMLQREIEQFAKAGELKGGVPKVANITASGTIDSFTKMEDIDRELDSTGYVDAVTDLEQAALSSDPSARRSLYIAAIAARQKVLDTLRKGDRDELTLEEDEEGSATYVGMTAEQLLAGAPIPLDDRVPNGFGSIHTAPKGGRIPLFYQMGYLMCLALADLQPDWQTAWLNNNKALSEMLNADLTARP